MVEAEVIIVPIVFCIPALVVFARMWFKHKEKMATLGATPTTNPALEARLARIEEAVDTIAVEMERMGEGQRFVTKLLAERASTEGGAEVAKDSTSGESGRLTTKR